MNPEKLQCLTTACWLRGYADTLDEFTYSALIHRMNQAATLLEKTCDKCSHYTPSKEYSNEGKCAMMGDSNDGPIPVDRAAGWDSEKYSAGVCVGPKFGCIHWVTKETT